MIILEPIERLLQQGLADEVFPGAVLLVAKRGEILLHCAVGHAVCHPVPKPMQMETVFDLASLTKPLATALGLARLVGSGRLHLDATLGELGGAGVPADKRRITIRQLLAHASGLPAWRPFFEYLATMDPCKRRRQMERMILAVPLEYDPGTATLYSDLGYLLLGWLLETVSGDSLAQFVRDELYRPLGCRGLGYRPVGSHAAGGGESVAATEYCPWRQRVICGEVHDENAYVLGGVAGHAGLFGTATDIYLVLEAILDTVARRRRSQPWSPAVLEEFLAPADLVPGSTWCLGFDTPAAQNSSAGTRFGPKSVGHLGFTGTSFWVDLEREIAVIFLTNRIHLSRGNDRIRWFRPRLHDAVMASLGV